MPYSVEWYLEAHILYNRLYGEISSADILGLDRETLTHLESVPHKIHLIHDDRQATGNPPFNLATFRDMIQSLRHPHLGWLITLGEGNPTSRFISTVMGQLFGFKMKRVASVELALAFLQEQDPQLTSLLAKHSPKSP